ncbi:hypothetical protein C7E23_03075 [Elizabethkingia anophelis]|nr:hypothetical protein C7E23_03075 [Elizabethkingia anophelis]
MVINPKRTEGNINVNREKQLMNIRLLLNLLDLHDPLDTQKSFRCIEDGKSIKYFTIHLDTNKCEEVRDKIKEITDGNEKIKEIIIDGLYFVFEINKKVC